MGSRVVLTDEEACGSTVQPEVEEYPLPVAEDWDGVVAKADAVAQVIDAHLDHESRSQGVRMRPGNLCGEQKVNLMTDVREVSRREQ